MNTTKNTLIAEITKNLDLPKSVVSLVVNEFLSVVSSKVKEGPVKIHNFGKFFLRTLKARMRSNPKTGEKFMSGEITVVKFKASESL